LIWVADHAGPAQARKLCVVGLGYIGLPTACMFATHGFDVVGVDVDENLLAEMAEGCFSSAEPRLNDLVRAALGSGRLRLARRPEPADAFIIAVPTPALPWDEPLAVDEERDGARRPPPRGPARRADLRQVLAAAESIVPHLRPDNLVVLESTVPPGTTRDHVVPLLERSGLRASRRVAATTDVPAAEPLPTLFAAHCPERVLPGRIVEELTGNDRVIGGIDCVSAERARALYTTFVTGCIHVVDATTAEMIKLMENTYRDVNIALTNEFALLAEEQGVDVWEAIDLANRHPRVRILRPGPGVGGHCIPVDPYFLIQDTGHPEGVIASARRLNDRMPEHVADVVERALAGVHEAVVAVLGLAYKAHVDDTRESPAVAVVEGLQRRGYTVRVHDPYVAPENAQGIPLLPLDEAVAGADCVLVLTDHSEYQGLDLDRLSAAMRQRVVVDARHCLSLAEWSARGFRTYRLGSGVR
jgi:UDP-N-acetyl-D-mannosaminuronic acid dehydrogenase